VRSAGLLLPCFPAALLRCCPAAALLLPCCPGFTTHSQTLENTREADVTLVAPGDEEVALDEADDEFAGRNV
jgi:hypothetical protein